MDDERVPLATERDGDTVVPQRLLLPPPLDCHCCGIRAYEGAASGTTVSDCRLQALSQFVGDSNQATDDGIYTNSLISLSSLSLSDDFDSTPELTFNAGPSFQHLHVVAIAGQHTLWCLYYMINNADLLDYLPLRLYIVFVHFTVSFLFFPLTSNHLK